MRWIAPTIFLIGLFFVIGFRVSASEPYPCSNCFIGELKLIDNPGDPTRRTKKVDADLKFIDLDQTAWMTVKGDVTDGATIPELFQPIIGGRWEEAYLPAAVMHDHYTKHLVRTWWATDRMFYQAMLAKEVSFIKASIMYYAVYVFGPHWGELEDGEPCGPNCTRIGKAKIMYQRADYNPSHALELKEVERRIANAVSRGAPLNLADLELLAAKKHKDNAFLRMRKIK